MEHEYQVFNMRTQRHESFNGDWRDYIPQTPPSLNLFDLLVETGKEPIEAALHILKITIGERPEQSPEGE